jgi:mannose-6-phosphate isomerase-like protein (cupin superfamily)
MPADVIEDPVLRQRYGFSRSVGADGQEVLKVEMWIDPGGGVTPHIHPAMEERFEVQSGTPSFLCGRKWATAGPGETVVVPAGLRHAYRNNVDEVAHVVCHATPPSSLQEFLEEAAALNRSGGLTSHGLPRRPSVLLAAAAMAHRHREMVILLFPPLPPPRVQRLVIPALARLGQRRRARGAQSSGSDRTG